MIDFFSSSLLRRHVGHRPESCSFSCQQSSPFDLGQTEIHDLSLALFGDHDVGAFDVPVNYASLVGFLQAFSHLDSDLQGILYLQRPFLYSCLQALSLNVLHGNEGFAFFFIDFMDGADIGMGQACCRLSLQNKPYSGLLILDQFRGQELESDTAFELRVFGLVDDPHSPSSHHLFDGVLAGKFGSGAQFLHGSQNGPGLCDEHFLRRMNRRPAFAAETGVIRDSGLTFRTFHCHFSLFLI